MVVAKILTGILMLVAGQKFIWFFIGGMGFWAGYDAALAFFFGMPSWQLIGVGFLCGLLGLALAVFLQGAAVVSAGFVAGVYIFFRVWGFFNFGTTTGLWWVFLMASGAMGSVLLAVFFNPALVIISSLIGAMLVVQCVPAGLSLKSLLFALLFITGVLIQSGRLAAWSPKNSIKGR